jgi:hypothetical protein
MKSRFLEEAASFMKDVKFVPYGKHDVPTVRAVFMPGSEASREQGKFKITVGSVSVPGTVDFIVDSSNEAENIGNLFKKFFDGVSDALKDWEEGK